MSGPSTPLFDRYVGIDYSGAETPTSSRKGLRIYMADRISPPAEIQPPPSPRKYWTRKEIAEWIVGQLHRPERSLIGIDHAFSFPLQYFTKHNLPHDWPAFLDDFQLHWPTDEEHVYVEFVHDGFRGNGAARSGNSRWRRMTEKRTGKAKSVFHFNVPGSVATATHAGLPWLRYIRRNAGSRVHFWPFDGWAMPADRSAIIEAYPSLWSSGFPRQGRTSDQQDAFSVTEWMRQTDLAGRLNGFFCPSLTTSERTAAQIEGWILGIM